MKTEEETERDREVIEGFLLSCVLSATRKCTSIFHLSWCEFSFLFSFDSLSRNFYFDIYLFVFIRQAYVYQFTVFICRFITSYIFHRYKIVSDIDANFQKHLQRFNE